MILTSGLNILLVTSAIITFCQTVAQTVTYYATFWMRFVTACATRLASATLVFLVCTFRVTPLWIATLYV